MNKEFRFLFIFVLYLVSITLIYSRDFIIAGIPEEPLRWNNSSGKVVGLDVDIIDYIMKKMGIKYKIILINSSKRLESMQTNNINKCDMIFTYSKNKEREKYLIYPKESHIEFSYNFFIRKEDLGKYKFNSIEDLKGLKIGVTNGFAYTPEFWEAAKKGVFKTDSVVKNSLQTTKLLNKRFDMVPLSTVITLYELKKNKTLSKFSYLPIPLTKRTYYNTFVKSSDYPNMNEIIKQYDIILGEMKADGTLKSIFDKYGF